MALKKLDIKKPCSENWDEMTPLAHGRYCGSCNHVIHDFSEMTDDELLSILQSGKYSCGRFEKKQMGFLYQSNVNNSDRKKYWNSIAAAIIGGMLQISIGYTQAPVVKKQLIIGNQTNRCIDCEDASSSKLEEESRTLTIDFKILDYQSKKPIPYAYVQLFGRYAKADSLGRVSFKVEGNMDVYTELVLNIDADTYTSTAKRIQLINCVGVTHIYLRKAPVNKNKEYVLGFF